MAEYLASVYGTEKDKVNCSFYIKTGACRHGETCARLHVKPVFSTTVVLQGFCLNAASGTEESKETFEELIVEFFEELEDKYGRIEEMAVCQNHGDHLLGNVYIMFRSEEAAEKAVNELPNRWFGGRLITAELSPVTDFREASCRQFEEGNCKKGEFCNFWHPKSLPRRLRRGYSDYKGRRH